MGLIKQAMSGQLHVPRKDVSDGKIELVVLDCRSSGIYVKAVALVKTKDGWRMIGDSPSSGIMLDIDPEQLPREEIEAELGVFEVIKLPLKVKARPITPVRFKDVEIVGEVSLEELDEMLSENSENIIAVRGVVESGVVKLVEGNKEVIIFPSRSTEGGKKLEVLENREVLVIGSIASSVELRDTIRYKLKWTLPIPIEQKQGEQEETVEEEAEEKVEEPPKTVIA